MRSRVLFFLGAVLALLEFASSESLAIDIRAAALPDLPQCTFEGNSDFYGVGVRVGFYLTWISGLVAFVLNPGDSEGQADAQTIFLMANLIAVTVLQVQEADETNVVVPILLFYMFFGGSVIGITSGMASLGAYKTARGLKKVSTVVRQIFVQLTFIGMLLYSFYFWTKGFKAFAKFDDICGGTFVFPVKKRLQLETASAGAVLALLFMVLFYILIWLVSYKRLRRSFGKKTLPWHKVAIAGGAEKTQGPPWEPRQRTWTILGGVLISFTIIWSVAAIELTLVWNRVTGVNTLGNTGQLIPFVIGIASLPSSFWHVLEYIQDTKEEEKTRRLSSEQLEMTYPEKPQMSPGFDAPHHQPPSKATPSNASQPLLSQPQAYTS